MAKALVGRCGWSYGDLAEKGGWTGAFYPGTLVTATSPYSVFDIYEYSYQLY
jgi:hypothetical protein